MAIISFQFGFIFVKTRKTAGTSIEVDLSKVVGTNDIVTPIIPEVKGHVARCHKIGGNSAFWNHMSAEDIRALLGEKVFKQMKKFCVEREPVSKCISHFHMLRNSPIHNPGGKYKHSWSQYVEEANFPVDHASYSEVKNGQRISIVDSILRYENLQSELAAFLQDTGIESFQLQSRAKSEYSKRALILESQITASEKRRIYEKFDSSNRIHKLY